MSEEQIRSALSEVEKRLYKAMEIDNLPVIELCEGFARDLHRELSAISQQK